MINTSFQWDDKSSKQSIETQQAIYTYLAKNRKLILIFLFSMWIFICGILTIGFKIQDYASGDTALLITLGIVFIFLPFNSFLNRKYSGLITAAVAKETITSSRIHLTMDELGIKLKCDTGDVFLKWEAVSKFFIHKDILALNCDLHPFLVPLEYCQPTIQKPEIIKFVEKMTNLSVVDIEEIIK